MALVSQAIKNLKGGISQQPDILRYDDQGASQVNAFSSEVEGLQKRPPTVHMKRLANMFAFGGRPLIHTINRDETEQYAAVFTGETVRVFDLQSGVEQTVEFPKGTGHLAAGNPREDLRMVTVADYTFIVNKKAVVTKGSTTSSLNYDPERNAIVSCRGGQYSRTFRVIINGSIAAEYKTPTGDDITHASLIDIRYILDQLAASFAEGFGKLGWAMRVGEGYAHIECPGTDTIRSIKVEDGYNGQLLSVIRDSAKLTTDLPVYAPSEYCVTITGEPGGGKDEFYVKFDAERNVWTEIAKPGILLDINGESMPWTLIRQASGTFTYQPAEWAPRAAGDDETNPFPSFIDGTIEDVFFFRNRLGFLSGENVILSEAGSYFNMFPPSVAVTSDSDPIDVAVSTNKISILKFAIPFAEELLLWSEHNQFVLGADGILTPTSVKLDVTTEFEVSPKARPFSIGRGVYFIAPRANYSTVRRYYSVQDVTQVKNAEDVTAHVPSFIPNGVHYMGGSSTENFLTVLTEGAPHHIYFYKFLYLNEELVQQSWSFWDLGEGSKVLSCSQIGATMYLIIDSPSGIFLEKVTFTQNTKDYAQEPYRLYMDRKAPVSLGSERYDWDTNKTTFKLRDVYGQNPARGDYYLVLSSGVSYSFTMPTGGWGTTDGLLEIEGDITGETMYIGEAYEMRYEFSKFLIKQTDAAGGVATEDIGRLQLRRAWVNYEKSGLFNIYVSNQGREHHYQMTGARLGSRQYTLGEGTLDTGQFRYPVAGNAKNVTVLLSSSTPNPVAIIGGGWEGNYVRRSSGI